MRMTPPCHPCHPMQQGKRYPALLCHRITSAVLPTLVFFPAVEIKTWCSEENGMGHWYQLPVQLILSISSWTGKPETLQHSVLLRELSFVAGSQQRWGHGDTL